MAWQKKNTAEHKEFVDLGHGMHVIPLHDPVSGAEHKLQIVVGHDHCTHCGHVSSRSGLDEIDVKGHVQQQIDELNLSHDNQRAYARKHGIPVRGVKR